MKTMILLSYDFDDLDEDEWTYSHTDITVKSCRVKYTRSK